jgi:hypothetical protein
MNSFAKLSLASLLVLGLGVASFPLSTSADSAKEDVQKKVEISTMPDIMGFNVSIGSYIVTDSSISTTGGDISLTVYQYLTGTNTPANTNYQLVHVGGTTTFPQIITITGEFNNVTGPTTRVFKNVPAGTWKLRIGNTGDNGLLNARGYLSTY